MWTAMPGPSAKAGNAVFASTQYWTTLNVGGYVVCRKMWFIYIVLAGRPSGRWRDYDEGWGWG